MQFSFGSGVMYAVRTDIANQTPVRFGAMQDISIEFNADTKKLYSQSQFPIDSARAKVDIMGKAKLAQINAIAFNTIFFGGTLNTGEVLNAFNEVHTIPGTPYEVTATNSGTFVADLGVYYTATGNALEYTTGTPTAGQYSESAGVYTFAAADTTLDISLNYLYTSTDGYTIQVGNPFMGTTPRFMGVFSNVYEGNSIVMQLYACVAAKLSFPTKVDDYTIPELDFTAYANAGGQTVDLSMST